MELEKLWIVIDKETYRETFRKLAEKLEREGLPVAVMSATEFVAEKLNGRDAAYQNPGNMVFTDSAFACRTVLSENGCVTVFLHEGNREEDFSGVSYAAETLEDLNLCYFERIYQRLTGQPWEILQTNRCILRETVEADVDVFYEMYSEPSLTEYTEPLYEDKEKERQYIRDYRDCYYRFYEYGIWTVLKKDTGEVIGRAGINLRDGYKIPEIGFVIGKPWQRQGYAYEICSAILDYAKEELGMDTLQALVVPENAASAELCKKLGFRERGETEVAGQKYTYLVYLADGGKKW